MGIMQTNKLDSDESRYVFLPPDHEHSKDLIPFLTDTRQLIIPEGSPFEGLDLAGVKNLHQSYIEAQDLKALCCEHSIKGKAGFGHVVPRVRVKRQDPCPVCKHPYMVRKMPMRAITFYEYRYRCERCNFWMELKGEHCCWCACQECSDKRLVKKLRSSHAELVEAGLPEMHLASEEELAQQLLRKNIEANKTIALLRLQLSFLEGVIFDNVSSSARLIINKVLSGDMSISEAEVLIGSRSL